MSFVEKFTDSAPFMIIGICIILCIFAVLILLITMLIRHISRKKKDTARAQLLQNLLPDIPEPVFKKENIEKPKLQKPQTADSGESISETELAAVIMAAIAAYRADCGSSSLIVRKITRISGNDTSWSNAAKMDCIESRKF